MALKDHPRSKYSADQIFKHVFDEDSASFRMKPHDDMEFAVSISADDGDSVLSIRHHLKMEGPGEAPCVGIKRVYVYSSDPAVKLEASPDADGDLWTTLQLSAGLVEICAMRVRLSGDAKLVGQG